ncbi:MAG: alpha/beta hydrolase [Lentisphaerae bacterium]|nr:alpha/beta hydrolase [Lentisphaerota bacterium]
MNTGKNAPQADGAVTHSQNVPEQDSPRRELLWPEESGFIVGEKPAITPFLPPPNRSSNTGVIICPGGGYVNLALGHEGADTACWLNSLGVAAFVLEYRNKRENCLHPAPLQDAQRAIRTVRARAGEWNLRTDRIGILGYSAGGHLAATAGTHSDSGRPESTDPVERAGCRPDFMILCYPAITMGEPITHPGCQRNLLGADPSPELVRLLSVEKQVTAETPPAFIFHTTEDATVHPANSTVFYEALVMAGVPAELHIHQRGRHGLGMAPDVPGTCDWTRSCGEWLRINGWLTAPE